MNNQSESLPPVHVGCPIWTHATWKKRWFGDNNEKVGLSAYSQQCNSVEGNTTFYQTPSAQRANEWADSVDETFRFSLKLPSTITHDAKLLNCEHALRDFWQSIEPLHHHIGVLMAQLPASFGPKQIDHLQQFLDEFDLPVNLAVEVRHQAFFAKGEEEKRLNQMLVEHGVNRVIMDTRALFANEPASELEIDVQRKKPRVPVNVIATAQSPVVRFVGGNCEQTNLQKMQPWVHKVHSWRTQGKIPYVFIHCIDNADAPWLLDKFIQLYNENYNDTALPLLRFPTQSDTAQISLL